MQAFSQSPFLQALGYAIANSFWQVAILWLLASVVNNAFKVSSHTRYRVALTAQLASFGWFLGTLQFYFTACDKALQNAQQLALDNTFIYQPSQNNTGSNLLAYVLKAEALLPYLSVAYMALLVVLTIRWFRGYRYTQLVKTAGLEKATMDWRVFVHSMAKRIGITQNVSIYFSSFAKTPLTIGFLKPIILVPLAAINNLSQQQLEAVLLHELAHIKRADYLVNLLVSIIEISLFFNPFTRLLGKTIQKEREHCCDDWVLQFQYSAGMYAEALLRIAYMQTSSPAMAMSAVGKSKKGGELLWRVKRLLNQNEKKFSYSQQLIALVLTTGILTSVAWLQPTNKPLVKPAVADAHSSKTIVVAPMTAQVDNPLFNPLMFLSKPLKEEVKKATENLVKASVNKALSEASNAVINIVPVVSKSLQNVKFDNITTDANTEAQSAIEQTDWDAVTESIPVFDSIQFSSTINTALSSVNLSNINLDLNKARVQLLNLVKLKKNEAAAGAKAATKLELQKLLSEKNMAIANQAITTTFTNIAGSLGNAKLGKILNAITITGRGTTSDNKNGKVNNTAPQEIYLAPAPPKEVIETPLPPAFNVYVAGKGAATNLYEFAADKYASGNKNYTTNFTQYAVTNDEDDYTGQDEYNDIDEPAVTKPAVKLKVAKKAKQVIHVTSTTGSNANVNITIEIDD